MYIYKLRQWNSEQSLFEVVDLLVEKLKRKKNGKVNKNCLSRFCTAFQKRPILQTNLFWIIDGGSSVQTVFIFFPFPSYLVIRLGSIIITPSLWLFFYYNKFWGSIMNYLHNKRVMLIQIILKIIVYVGNTIFHVQIR